MVPEVVRDVPAQSHLLGTRCSAPRGSLTSQSHLRARATRAAERRCAGCHSLSGAQRRSAQRFRAQRSAEAAHGRSVPVGPSAPGCVLCSTAGTAGAADTIHCSAWPMWPCSPRMHCHVSMQACIAHNVQHGSLDARHVTTAWNITCCNACIEVRGTCGRLTRLAAAVWLASRKGGRST